MQKRPILLIVVLLIALVLAAGCTAAGQQDSVIPTAPLTDNAADSGVPEDGCYVAIMTDSPSTSITIQTSQENRDFITHEKKLVVPFAWTSGEIDLVAGTDKAPIYAAIFIDGSRYAVGYSGRGSIALTLYPTD